ncbi:MAG: GlsB/YeaQ/YmgE family stress response membrane protein, partial [Xanthobacteraceae bacterium]
MSILWTIIIGFVAGVIARFFHPGNKYEPTGFIWTTVLGIVGAFAAT